MLSRVARRAERPVAPLTARAGPPTALKLPAVLADEERMASIEAGHEHAEAGQEEPIRILVADDDPDILFLVSRLLERAGYDVVRARDGREALQLARETLPDLLILDVSMPGADGYAVCRAIQADGPNAPPVIFLTANALTAARVDGLDAGAVDYIVKPFEPDELTARVRAALRTKTVRDVLATEASTDPLTGLLNRNHLGTRLAELVAAARRYGRPLACLMFDIDHFKAVNDTYGHLAGDGVLREVAARLTSGEARVGRARAIRRRGIPRPASRDRSDRRPDARREAPHPDSRGAGDDPAGGRTRIRGLHPGERGSRILERTNGGRRRPRGGGGRSALPGEGGRSRPRRRRRKRPVGIPPHGLPKASRPSRRRMSATKVVAGGTWPSTRERYALLAMALRMISAARAASSGRASSSGWWLIPSLQGTKTIALGTLVATHIVS